MSLSTWKAEFYQLDADAEAVQVDDITRTRHSLQKWVGLREENLAKHRVVKAFGLGFIKDAEAEKFWIDNQSCALCKAYDDDCYDCPLYKQRNQVKCDARTKGENDDGLYPPYQHWVNRGNPEPMIAALEATLQSLTKVNDNPTTTT